MRVNVVIRYIGLVLQFVAAFMLLSAVVSMLNGYDSAYYPLLLSSFMTALLGTFPLFFVERVDEIKTKAFAQILDNLKISNKALFVLGDMDQNVILSARNLPGTKTTQTSEINVYDIMNAQTLVLTKDAVAKIEEVYA